MFIHKLTTVNWCQHRSRSVTFGDLTQVRGPNGSGKTNLINAVIFALTGESGNEGNKDDDISYGTPDSRPSSVELAFSHHGAECRVTRSVRGAKCEVEINGEKTTGSRAAGDKLRQLLRVDERLLRGYVFVPQWKMFQFISQKDTERSEAFAHLFGTAKAEKIWKALGAIKLPPVSVAVDGDAVKQRLQAVDKALFKARDDVNSLYLKLLPLEQFESGRNAAIRSFDLAATRVADAERLRVEEGKVREELEAEGEKCREALKKMSDCRIKVEQLSAFFEEAKTCALAWERINKNALVKAELSTALANNRARAARHEKTVPVLPHNYIRSTDRESYRQQLTATSVNLSVVMSFLASVDPERGVAACTTCGTPVTQPDLADRIKNAKLAEASMRPAIQSLQAALSASDCYDVQRLQWEKERNHLASLVAAVECQLFELGDLTTPHIARETCLMLLAQYADLQAEASVFDSTCRILETKVAALKARQEVVSASLQSIEKDLTELKPPTPAAVAKLRKDSEVMQELRLELNTARSVLKHSEEVKAECESLMTQYREQQSQYWLVKNTEMRLDTLRSLFHRDKLPAMVHSHYLENIRGEANDVLEGFDSDFRISSVQDLKFVVKFANGQLTPANRLSGGQKVVLALAYRMAVHSLFANELGLLCLDEPTAGLDSRSLKVVESALSRLREVGRVRRLQVILITHDPLLDNLCDTVIDLATPG